MGSEAIRDSLQKLVAARFIERVPSPEPVLGNKDEGPAQKKRGAKASKVIHSYLVFSLYVCLFTLFGNCCRSLRNRKA